MRADFLKLDTWVKLDGQYQETFILTSRILVYESGKASVEFFKPSKKSYPKWIMKDKYDDRIEQRKTVGHRVQYVK